MRWGQRLSVNPDGSFVYPVWGDGTLWGQADIVTNILTWAIEIDWDGDGNFDGSNEMPYCFDISIRRGRRFFMNSNGTGFQPIETGEAVIQLNNYNGRFDAYNLDGSLYGMISPGKKFRIRVKRESDGAIKDIFVGRILDIRPSYGDLDTITITAQDNVALLKDSNVLNNVQTLIRYNDAIENILESIDWTNGSSIDNTVSDTMPYWWGSGKNAFDEITDLVNAALGLFYVSSSGEAIYLDRLNTSDPILEITDSDWMKNYGVRIPQPWEVVKNVIRIYARTRTTQSTVEIWRMSDTPTIAAGQSITVWATFSYNNQSVPATSIITPSAGGDYDVEEEGVEDISIVMTSFATSAKLVITNNGGSSHILILMKLRGNVIVADPYTFAEDSDDDSVSENGRKFFEVKTDWLQDINSATEQINILLSVLASPKQFPRIMLRGNPEKQFECELFDIHTLNLASKNIGAQLRVGYIEHKSISRSLDLFETTLFYEPNIAGETSGTWIFPATFGLTTVF